MKYHTTYTHKGLAFLVMLLSLTVMSAFILMLMRSVGYSHELMIMEQEEYRRFMVAQGMLETGILMVVDNYTLFLKGDVRVFENSFDSISYKGTITIEPAPDGINVISCVENITIHCRVRKLSNVVDNPLDFYEIEQWRSS